MNKFFCGRLSKKGNLVKNSGCGELEFVHFDGYRFNEQELTNVKFQLDKKGEITSEQLEYDCETDEQFHMILNDAKAYAQVALVQNLDFECPFCEREVYVEYEDDPPECNSSI